MFHTYVYIASLLSSFSESISFQDEQDFTNDELYTSGNDIYHAIFQLYSLHIWHIFLLFALCGIFYPLEGPLPGILCTVALLPLGFLLSILSISCIGLRQSWIWYLVSSRICPVSCSSFSHTNHNYSVGNFHMGTENFLLHISNDCTFYTSVSCNLFLYKHSFFR